VETIEVLLAAGANLEHKNRYGASALGQALWSALHSAPAMQPRSLRVVEVLIDAGARVGDDIASWVHQQKEAPLKLKQQIVELLDRKRK
jgi:hypothetical protein